ncbi:hypothetical protein [Neobacillus mesonae]|uniref:hypothetical protein n=1 Tax=Neobacillus mesonae TaxID=1193713 RepID=UPI00203C021C|nr:hypothetical protein [Neobacillus mesonae]MCM3571185.1 hypothetical protein [Neobacillus mesonae]
MTLPDFIAEKALAVVRTPDHPPYFLKEDDERNLEYGLVKEILLQWQKSKEFTDFHLQVISTIIQRAISEFKLTF